MAIKKKSTKSRVILPQLKTPPNGQQYQPISKAANSTQPKRDPDQNRTYTMPLIAFLAIIATMLVAFSLLREDSMKNAIIVNSYAECIRLPDSRIQESYPPVCVAANGQQFTAPLSPTSIPKPASTVTPSTVAGNLYTNTLAGISFTYPKPWELSFESSASSELELENELREARQLQLVNPDFSENSNRIIRQFAIKIDFRYSLNSGTPDTQCLAEINSDDCLSLLKISKDYSLETIAGTNAIILENASNVQVLLLDKQGYVLSFVVPFSRDFPEESEQILNSFETILDSLALE